jgi:hypothetical protein
MAEAKPPQLSKKQIAFFKEMGKKGWQAKIDKYGEKKARKLQRKGYLAGMGKISK